MDFYPCMSKTRRSEIPSYWKSISFSKINVWCVCVCLRHHLKGFLHVFRFHNIIISSSPQWASHAPYENSLNIYVFAHDLSFLFMISLLPGYRSLWFVIMPSKNFSLSPSCSTAASININFLCSPLIMNYLCFCYCWIWLCYKLTGKQNGRN